MSCGSTTLGLSAACVLLLAAACAGPPAPPAERAPSGVPPPWGSVLGGSGGSAADAVVDRATPPCLVFDERDSLERRANALRAEFAMRLGIDLARRARSAVVQRKLQTAELEVEVVRLEVLDGIYLPLNVYRPRRTRPVAVVVAPVACSSSSGSAGPQALAANLAAMGMVVVVSEGFCENGARAALPDSDLHIGYARELLGLRSETAVYLQELVSALTWAIESHPSASAERVGVAGYSYGGQMSLRLAQVDTRVRSVSVPATGLGGACDTFGLATSDIHIQDPNHVWGAPLEVPALPRNAQIVMLYPRFLHTTAGARDRGALPAVVAGVMQYARDLYRLAGLQDRLSFRTDDGDHHYGRNRREHTYEWFARTLLRAPAAPRTERAIPTWPAAELAVDITGTRTLAEELMHRARAEREYRFLGDRPTPVAASRARREATEIFGARVAALTPEVVWTGRLEDARLRALRYRGEPYDVPALVLEGGGRAGSGTLLYIPENGMGNELDALRERARRYERVLAVDYLGIGELASDRVLLHTVAYALMYSEESLPQANVALLHGVLRSLGDGPVEIEGNGWAASLYACILRALEPARVRRLHLSGVPDDELGWLGAGKKVPDLLLHPELFSHLTAAELAL